jgi:hypothetical protein
MKKPIITYQQRNNWSNTEFELAKMQLYRAIGKSIIGKIAYKSVIWLSHLLSPTPPTSS